MTSTEKVEEKSSAEDESARISEEQFLRAQADYEKAVAEAKRAEEEARLLSESEAANAELASRRYIQEQMFPLQLKLDQMRTKYGPDHPKVIEIQKEIETTRPQVMEVAALMKQKKTPVTPRIVPVPPKPITPKETPTNDQKKEQEDVAPEPILDPITVYQDSLKQELLTIQRNRTSLEEQAKSEETLARSLMQDEILENNKIKEMDRLTQLFQGYLTKINETKVNADIGGVKSQILKPARYGWLVYPIMPQFIGMGAFLGGFLGMCIAYAGACGQQFPKASRHYSRIRPAHRGSYSNLKGSADRDNRRFKTDWICHFLSSSPFQGGRSISVCQNRRLLQYSREFTPCNSDHEWHCGRR